MREEPEFRLWTEGLWRCEFWSRYDGGELRLYYKLDLRRRVKIPAWRAASELSTEWRGLILRENRSSSEEKASR